MAGQASRENGKKGGRPKGFAALEAERQRAYVAEVLVKEFKPIVLKAVKQAKEGDKYAREWLTDRAFGKAQQHVDHTTEGKELPQPIFNVHPNNSNEENIETD